MEVILISGKAEHGKSTSAALIIKKLESLNKKVLKIAYGNLLKHICKQYFGWDGEKNETGRFILQSIGTDKIRAKDPNYWVNFVKGFVKLFEDEFDYVIVDDARFENECVLWMQDGWNVVTLRVNRIGHTSKLTEKQLLHPSETSLDNFDFDYIMTYENGLENLEIEVNKFIEYLEVV